MKSQKTWLVIAALSVSVLGLGAGCQNTKLEDEKASLLKQNQDLEAQLKAERDASARARAALAARNAVVAPTTERAPTGLEGAAGVSVGQTARGEQVIEIEGDVLFDSAKATIKPEFEATLDKIAEVIKNQYPSRLLRIEGHTDPRPIRKSGWDDNWDLGAGRARAVALYLIKRGVPKKNVYIASFADNDLKSTTDLAADRRVDIVVVK